MSTSFKAQLTQQADSTLDNGLQTIETPPYYLPSGDEIDLFTAAYTAKLPVMLKGPTGCGKTRFVEFMAHQLGRPLVTVACHEDLFASDLVGRFHLQNDSTVWMDGPLSRAVKTGAICYLDEIVEARKDTTVVIHPLCDDRRILPVEKKGEMLFAHNDFFMVISYNPGYQSVLKDLKQSTRQRFVAIEFSYPAADTETKIVTHEGAVDSAIAERLVTLAGQIRNMQAHELMEGASTRLLIYAAKLHQNGIPLPKACRTAICQPLNDDPQVQQTLNNLIDDLF